LVSWVPCAAESQVILEPTRTYHQPLVQALAAEGIPYTVINPARTAAFARLRGVRAKTDRVDARLLARLGESQQPEASLPPDPAQEEQRALRRHLVWLEQEAQRTRNRLEAAQVSPWTPPAVVESLERTVRQLEEEARAAQEALDQHRSTDRPLAAQGALLTSIPGIGTATAQLLVTALPPVERCTQAKQWVAFCGLNPEPRESGNSRYSRLSRGGTARVRAGLYLPAVSALRWNPVVKAQSDRLRARGKSGRVRVVAAMHKLLRLCFGVLKSGRPFDLSLHATHLANQYGI
jgi:transposase